MKRLPPEEITNAWKSAKINVTEFEAVADAQFTSDRGSIKAKREEIARIVAKANGVMHLTLKGSRKEAYRILADQIIELILGSEKDE